MPYRAQETRQLAAQPAELAQPDANEPGDAIQLAGDVLPHAALELVEKTFHEVFGGLPQHPAGLQVGAELVDEPATLCIRPELTDPHCPGLDPPLREARPEHPEYQQGDHADTGRVHDELLEELERASREREAPVRRGNRLEQWNRDRRHADRGQ